MRIHEISTQIEMTQHTSKSERQQVKQIEKPKILQIEKASSRIIISTRFKIIPQEDIKVLIFQNKIKLPNGFLTNSD